MGIKVLVIEDDPDLAERFCAAIRCTPGLEVCGTAGTLAQARRSVDELAPDVLLVDLGLPDGSGIDLIRHAKKRHPACDALVMTMFGDEHSVADSIMAGATGYLLKDTAHADIGAAVLEVRAGGSPLSASVARRVLALLRGASTAPPAGAAAGEPLESTGEALSERELEILHLVAKGLNFKEVALVLEISPYTVATHAKRIYQKLSVHSRGEAVYEAGQLGLL